MRQVFLSRSGSIQVESAPAPACGPGEVLIDVAHSVISTGTETSALASQDLRARLERGLQMARMGVERLRTRGFQEVLRKARVRDGISAPLGYSLAGVARAAGEDVTDLALGARVAAGGSAYAFHAEQVAVPRNLVVPVPDSVSLRAASFATVGAIALQGVRRVAPQVGETVVVVGLGLVGQLAVQILGASGCRVIGVDPREERVELARSGPGSLVAGSSPDADEIERIVRAHTGGVGADAVLLCAGTESSEPINTALRVVRQHGRVVIVGSVGLQLEREAFYRKEVELTMSCSYGPGRYDPSYEEGGLDYPIGFVRWTENRNLAAFLDLVARGSVEPERLVSEEHDLEDAAAAFAAAKAGVGNGVAVLLRYPGLAKDPARTVPRKPAVAAKRDGRIAIAVIGAGGFATETLLPALTAIPDFVLRTVVTQGSATAARVAQEFGAEHASTDAEAVLADAAVDAVVIATRHDSHAPLARAALRAGKHVFVEKPMGLMREEIDALRDEALASRRIFTVGYNRRYAPLVLRVRDALSTTPGPRVVVYRVNAGRVPEGHWSLNPRIGGGRIVGELCHMLDLLAFWLGPEVLEWSAAAVSASTHGAPSPQDVALSLRFRDSKGTGHAASLVYTSLGAPTLAKEWIEVHAGGGTLRLEDFARLRVHGLRATPETLRAPDKGHRAEIRAFRDAIRGKPSSLLGPEEAWRAADLALRIDEAVRRKAGGS